MSMRVHAPPLECATIACEPVTQRSVGDDAHNDVRPSSPVGVVTSLAVKALPSYASTCVPAHSHTWVADSAKMQPSPCIDGVASVDHAAPSKRCTVADPSSTQTLVGPKAQTCVASLSAGAPAAGLKPPPGSPPPHAASHVAARIAVNRCGIFITSPAPPMIPLSAPGRR